jgi:hypothetical protein
MSNVNPNTLTAETEGTKALVLRNRTAFAHINALTVEGREMIASAVNEIERSYAMACSIAQLKAALSPEIMRPIMALQGTRLGFRADKEYPTEKVKDVVVEAWLFGLRTHGNEINIIADNMYPTQEGFERLVNELIDAGTCVEHSPDLPAVTAGRWTCKYTATYTHRGQSRGVVRTFSGRHYGNATSDDQIVGKCRRKILREIHRQITGLSLSDSDDTDRTINVTPTRPEPPRSTGILEASGGKPATDPKPEPTVQQPAQVEQVEQEPAQDRSALIARMKEAMLDHDISEARLLDYAVKSKLKPAEVDEVFALSTDTLAKLEKAIPALSRKGKGGA